MLGRYCGVDDVGTVINPMIVEGQIQGGIAQGLGQATCEHCFYDPDSGQLLSGSFMDYAIPRAKDMPAIISELDESQPCTTIRWAPRAAVKPARSARQPPSSGPCSTRCVRSAFSISRCR
jgi:xanthine dehydrogenase molybdopterin-binding subunit B